MFWSYSHWAENHTTLAVHGRLMHLLKCKTPQRLTTPQSERRVQELYIRGYTFTPRGLSDHRASGRMSQIYTGDVLFTALSGYARHTRGADNFVVKVPRLCPHQNTLLYIPLPLIYKVFQSTRRSLKMRRFQKITRTCSLSRFHGGAYPKTKRDIICTVW